MIKNGKIDNVMVIMEIPLDHIITDGQSVRNAKDDDHVVELAMSIAKHGLLEPIIVEETKKKGEYQLLAGFHRLSAFHRLKRSHIPAHIREKTGDSVKTIALIENIIRRDMLIGEEVMAVCHLNQVENLSASSICDLLGKSRDWVNKRLMIPNLPEEVISELMEGRIKIAHAEIIGSIQDPAARAVILNSVMLQKLSARQTEELAYLYTQTPSVTEAIESGVKKEEEIRAQEQNTRHCDACGAIRPLSEVVLMAVCMNGCAPVAAEKEGK